MKLPARFVAGNLVWTRTGSVWAVFRVEPATYPWLTHDEKLQLHRQTRSALIALGGPAMVVSPCAPVSPEELARRICSPDPSGYLARSAALATALEPRQRITFLAAELPARPARRGRPPALDAARSSLGETFGLGPARVPSAEIDRRSAQAHQLLERLRPFLGVEPAGATEVCWIYAAAVARGLGAPPPAPGRQAGWQDAPRLAALNDAVFTEGGRPDDNGRPRHRRYLRVDTEQGSGYQALLALSDMPHQFGFPGGAEWLLAAEQTRFPVDWCLRIRPVGNPAAQASARRQARQLLSQVGEYDGDPAGPPPGLAEAMEALGDLRTQLAANPTDAELRVTTIVALGSDRLEDLEEQVSTLRALYASGDYQLHRPIGGQLGLFSAMLPGSPAGSPARDYVHSLLGRDLAAGMPFAGVKVGDPDGALVGYSLDAGTFRPVLFDPAYGPSVNRSGSLGVFGALGSGKSYFIKNAIHATLARGGRVVVLDRTASGEYARLAEVAPVP
ncbi:MAG TPA: hypothetical protein VHA57_05365, partial [Actinomycetota bacterium]|nr:hypothetical protein [Actinomycetota bacterium]